MTEISFPDDDQAFSKYSLIAPCVEDGVSQTARAIETGVSRKTIARLIKRFRTGGIEKLGRKERSDKGKCRVSSETFKFIKGKLLDKSGLSFSTIHRQVERLQAHTGEFSASYRQVRSIRLSLSEDLVVLARSEKEFEETRQLLFRHEASFPNEVWQADHKYLDIVVWDSPGVAVKPVLTAILDDYSRAIAGYYLDVDPPSAQRTAIALRQAIWYKDDPNWLVCGIPDRVYTDRGSDFQSTRIRQVASELRFKLSKGASYKPQGRGKIERFFETVNQLLMSELPGFALGDDQPPPQPVIYIQQLQQLFHDWLISEYMHRIHSDTGDTPFARWSSHLQHPRLPQSLESLDVLLMTVPQARLVQQDGIRLFKHKYYAVELHGLTGKEVTVRYDPRDISEVLVYLENQLVCRATCGELCEQKQSLRDFLKARNAYKRGLKKEIEDAVKFAASLPDSQRHIPDIPVPEPKNKRARYPSHLRRYTVDE